MQGTFLFPTAAAALLAAFLAGPAAAEPAIGADPGTDRYATTVRAPVCTQLELSLGISGEDCGELSLAELARLKAEKENTNAN